MTSVNPVVGETNDGFLNDIRRRALTAAHARQAIDIAAAGPVAEGTVGAGTGTTAFGWKAGIGTSSRRLPAALGGYTLGVLVQTNFNGVLQMGGLPVGQVLGKYYLKDALDTASAGSIIIILATDAPLSDRNLTRLARRSFAGLARTGASFTNGSGDYALAFSTAEAVRRTPERRGQLPPWSSCPMGWSRRSSRQPSRPPKKPFIIPCAWQPPSPATRATGLRPYRWTKSEQWFRMGSGCPI